ncbi:EAL domain-containing protein [Campylobacter sp. RM16192]|uniref:EAL domain-containing protein n=1 Tax=Campylobacter sp. RM16192 TaxID=1660080 RepID=UPI001F3C3D8D|nr:GGDEF domain-containing phosphodiesterase [Campylobacter sp. RM16192]
MNLVNMIYKDIAKEDITKFQEYTKETKAIPSWILKGSETQKEFIVLASSEYPDLIGKPLPHEVCNMDARRYQELINKDYYKNVELMPDNKILICYFKKYKDIIIGYRMLHNAKILDFTDPYFKEWVVVNMKTTFILTTLILIVALFQYFLFFRKLKTGHEIMTNINSELTTTNSEIEYRLYFDPLTGLPNKESLQKDIELMKNPKIVIMDIDNFRKMNNYFGYNICNQVLMYLAELTTRIAEKEGMKVYRTGADQFTFVEDKNFFIDRYEELATKLLDTLKGLIIDVEREDEDKQDLIEVHCTVGFSLDESDTFKKAMLALEYAKSNGKDYFCYLKSIDDTTQYVEQIKRSNLIRNAIINDKIIPFYQPIFNAKKQVVKYEMLARIQNSREIISPNVFLDVSKRIKRYVDIEKVLLEKSFKLISDNPHALISVNLSGRDMTDGDMSVFIIDRINRYKIADRVVFEILEDENIENLERVIKFIDRVKNMGVRIAIDDFGSGYSNFSYLLRIKPDFIKIDGSIIKNVDIDDDSRSVAGAIIAFAKKLNITIVAEFVHSKSVFEACVDLGVDEFQGFYLGEPSDTLL